MKQLLANAALVGIGGCAGSVARYALALLLQRQSLVFPAGTLAANLGGCLIVGGLAQLAAPTPALSPEARLLLATGFCGGFTTLSSLIYELAQFLKDGEYVHAGGYLAASLVGSALAFGLGAWLVKGVFRNTGGLWN
jgi:CrcB protein